MIEQWKPVRDYEGLYEVSDFGRVKSLNYKRQGKTKVLNLTAKQGKYLKVTLVKDGISKTFYVHRLVADAFLPMPGPDQNQVNHRNGNKQDNFATPEYCNLEWVSPKENVNNPNTKAKMSIRYHNPGEWKRRSIAQKKRFREHPEDLEKMREARRLKRQFNRRSSSTNETSYSIIKD